jgi:hypothetical protein
VVPLVVLIGTEHACRFHSAASLRTEDTSDLQTTFKSQTTTVIADPVILRHNIDAVTLLVHRYVAHATKDNQVLVFVVSIVADSALGILLYDETSLVRAQLLVS